jgi:membrane protease YdiL (CAAX protease family)
MWRYVGFSYLLFWVMVLGLGGTASMVLHVSPLTMRWVANLCAWSPTIVLALMIGSLRPGIGFWEFMRHTFHGKLRVRLLVVSAASVIGGTLLSVWIVAGIGDRPFASFFNLGAYSLPLTVVLSLLSGPTGEEAGWRGYLRVELNSRYGFIRGSVLLGVIWAFWHTVLWFIDSDFSGFELIPYILANVVVLTALVIIMNVVMERSDNLFNAIWIHFWFNILYGFLVVDITFYVVLSVVYAAVAAVYLVIHLKAESIAIEDPH